MEQGNLGSVARGADGAWELRLAKDCEGTEHERRSSTWFYFRVRDLRGGGARRRVKMRIVGMNRQGALYRHGMRPFARSAATRRALGGAQCWASLQGEGGWERLTPAHQVTYKDLGDKVAELSWEWYFSEADAEFEFAFCPPYTVEEASATLAAVMEARVIAPFNPETNDEAHVVAYREVLCLSAEGRAVEILTVTDAFGAAADRESTLAEWCFEAPADDADADADADAAWLFPEVHAGRASRPPRYPKKPEVLISARVHPGETPGSFVHDGLLELLLRKDDPRSRQLRRLYVFRFVPVLNPDGVVRGHYRHDAFGMNLNRVYWPRPDAAKHPPQAALMVLARAAAANAGLALFVDLHAHATKRGVFIYGNAVQDADAHVENQLYALLLTVNSTHFDYQASNFSLEHMLRTDKADAGGLSAEGAARVGGHRFTGCPHCYTLECNYNTGRLTNHVPRARGEGANRAASPERPAQALRVDPYTVESWREVGRALGAALLDLTGDNPWDRIAASRWRNVAMMRQWLKAHPRLGQQAMASLAKQNSSSRKARASANTTTTTTSITPLAGGESVIQLKAKQQAAAAASVTTSSAATTNDTAKTGSSLPPIPPLKAANNGKKTVNPTRPGLARANSNGSARSSARRATPPPARDATKARQPP